ncbi:MAG: GNAT family protein [Pseudomonadota bacterium]
MEGVSIRPLRGDELDAYFAYLGDQLSDNGSATMPMFMPMPRSESKLSPEREAAFRTALTRRYPEQGWRQAWVAIAADGRIAGHVDLRANADKYAAHRCSLGMGTHRDFRFQGLGARLVAVAEAWARDDTTLAWIDLDVLSSNTPGLALYRRCGYTLVGEFADMFHLDGAAYGYTLMTKPIAR